MKQRIIILFLVLSALSAQSYYLNEGDFKSGFEALESETRGVSHIQVLWDSLERVSEKMYLNADGSVDSMERFHYGVGSDDILKKEILASSRNLIQETVFGPELHAEEFIKYLYQVDTVAVWDNRFTRTFYNNSGKPYLHEFYDVNGFQFGNIGFSFNNEDILTSQLWITMPSRQIIREWTYDFDPLTEVTRIREFDSLKTLVDDVSLYKDGTHSLFWFTGPADSSFINEPRVSFLIQDDMEWGRILFTPDAGNNDPVSSRVMQLNGDKLEKGEFKNVKFVLNPPLIDGGAYNVSVEGKSSRGLIITKRKIGHLILDQTAPEINLAMNKYINDVMLNFKIDEPLISASVIFRPDSLINPGLEEVRMFLPSKTDLSQPGRSVSSSPDIALVDSVTYHVLLSGLDRAGNRGYSNILENIIYDISPPVIFTGTVTDSDAVNNSDLIVSISEDLSALDIVYTATGGGYDDRSPHTIEYFPDQLKAGEQIFGLPDSDDLSDGTIYTIKLSGVDSAGNRSRMSSIESVLYDITQPVITMIFPYDNAAVRESAISYALSEDLEIGTVVWEPDSLAHDSVGPIPITLSHEEKSKGEKIHYILEGQEPLIDGVTYSLKISGADRAGNQAESVYVRGIVYDITPPEFFDIQPADNNYANSKEIGYKLSENLKEGVITWTAVSGPYDPVSPHISILSGDELRAGDHSSTLLTNEPPIIDSAVYKITFSGTDYAGNVSDTLTINNFRYDISPPILDLTYPISDTYIKDSLLSFSIGEHLLAGRFFWTPADTTQSWLKSVVYDLPPKQLKADDYTNVKFKDFPELIEGAVYNLSFSGVDSAGNKNLPVNINNLIYDFQPPVLTLASPLSGTAVNSKMIDFNFNEILKNATVNWEWLEGEKDDQGIHSKSLEPGELQAGDYLDHLIFNEPNLVNNGIYRIWIEGSDLAGNISRSNEIDSVEYDAIVPSIAVDDYRSDIWLNSPLITYTNSEDLEYELFNWAPVNGFDTIAVELNRARRSAGKKPSSNIIDQNLLQQGIPYTLTVSGNDRAQNKAEILTFTNLKYDFIPPEIALSWPASNSAVNSFDHTYYLSENLKDLSLEWRWSGGKGSAENSDIQEFTADQKIAGDHPDELPQFFPSIMDGGIYDLVFSGSDSAGNSSNVVLIQNVLYDITPPVVQVTSPLAHKYIATPGVSLSFSEDVFTAEISYRNTGGVEDTSGVHIYSLDKEFLSSGQHLNVAGQEEFLTEGSVYTVTINAADRAGNSAETVTIPGVVYDATPPVLAINDPIAGSAINHSRISFESSESLANGTLTWTRISGADDPGSPHVYSLAGNDLTPGVHELDMSRGIITLNDSTVYEITFSGMDPAGNEGTPAVISDVLYDISPPLLAVSGLETGQYINDPGFAYEISEDLQSGSIQWEGLNSNGEAFINEFIFDGELLSDGKYSTANIFDPGLDDGGAYSVTITAVDPAGNVTKPVTIKDIYYDITPPVISIQFPLTASVVNSYEIVYTISEQVRSGKVVISNGTSDFSINLAENELKQGNNGVEKLSELVDLLEQTPYNFTFNVTDLAGNVSNPAVTGNIIFDFTPPELAIISPLNDAFINNKSVEGTLSEQLKNGELLWATSNDTLIFPLSLETLKEGKFNLANYEGDLAQDAVYTIMLRGEDLAGNKNSSEPVSNITFDAVPPQISINSPSSGQARNTSQIGFSISENLTSLSASWMETGKPEIKVPLEGDLLRSGGHSYPGQTDQLIDGAWYSLILSGLDLAGNRGNSIQIDSIKYDITPPVLTLSSLSSDSFTNKMILTGSISEPVAKGSLDIDEESEGSINKVLTPSMIKSDLTFNLDLKELNYLPVDSGTMSISISAEDPAGNKSDEIVRTNIRYDQKPPRVTLIYPENRSYITDGNISYSVSEELESASISFAWTGGEGDPSFSFTDNLVDLELTPGKHDEIKLRNFTGLNDGSVYEILINAVDKAGNSGVSNMITRVKYDVTAPVGEIISPRSDSYNNRILLDFKVSENLMDCELEITAGENGQVEKINLLSKAWEDLAIKALDLGSLYKFSNDVVYTFTVSGKDSAGNALTVEPVTDVRFDDIPPTLSMATPVDEEQIRETVVSYNLSENLSDGWVVYTNETDPSKPPVRFSLSRSDLSSGWNQDVVLPIKDSLSDGSRYSVELNATDRAGNTGEPVIVRNVLFDFMPPVLALKSPGELPYINNEIMTYSSSEELKEGRIVFTRISGQPDPGSPHNIELTGGFLSGGIHEKAELPGLKLVSGAVYKVFFEGSDQANNAGEPVEFNWLKFDNDPPVLAKIKPDSGNYLNAFMMQYNLSEPLLRGRIDLISSGSTQNSYELISSELSRGNHSDINIIEKLSIASDGIYSVTISGQDSAGNALEPYTVENVSLDRVAPILSGGYPVSGESYNKSTFDYRINENLGSLKVTVNNMQDGRLGSTVNSFSLSGDQLKQGSYTDVPLEGLEGSLVHGNNYTYTINASDLAGNSASLSIKDVSYDIEAPSILLKSPAGKNISDTDLDYTIDETLLSGTFIWTPIEGGTPVLVPLVSSELGVLEFGPGKLTSQSPLVDGTIYNLSFKGTDPAGNSGETVLMDSVLFDQTEPVLSIVSPENGKAVNTADYVIGFSEDMLSAVVKWTEILDTGLEGEMQLLELTGNQLKNGEHGPVNLPQPALENGKSYSMVIEGTDLAGNRGNAIRINEIKYDTEPPVLEIVKPDTGDFTNKTSFGIKTSEPLELGRIYLENTGGVNDPESPRILEITGNRLTPVKPAGQKLGLIDGAVYTIRFEGQDYAGNKGITIEVPDVTFDNTLPELSLTYPVSDEIHNNKAVTYTLSEDLIDGRMTWVATGGKPDPGSPHILELSGEQLKSGTHTDTVVFPFVEGTVYSIELAGRDLAENQGTKFKTPYVSYDFTDPVLAFMPLEYGKYLNHKKISYSTTEDLFNSKVSWTPLNGTSGIVEISLSEAEAKSGKHVDILTIESPDLVDGTAYRVEFSGRDRAGNEGEPAVIGEIIYDISPPEVNITKPVEGQVAITPEISMNVSEPMRLAIIYWNATEGATDSIGHYEIKLTPEELVMMNYENHVFQEQMPLNPGTVYSMSITGLDSAWNEIPIMDVRNISIIKKLDGNWYFKGAIMTVVWTFESTGGELGETGRFSQGVQMGTKISNQESGTYKLDYSKKPWVMEWELDSGQKRYSLFELRSNNKLRVITGTQLPSSWQDGEVMIYENK